jgi:triosephosphate isomerase
MSAFNKMSVKDIDVAGKKVIVRVDFNVPLDDELNITDDKRIRSAVPTIKYLVDNKAKVIIMSHLGRPKGKFTDKYSLKPTAVRLSELLGQEVILAKDVVGEDAFAKASALKEGEVLMLENVRFHKEEEENDPEFCKKLASMADIYVNDAFGTAHRAHASTTGIADYLPAVCGFLIEKEIAVMGKALENPKRPFVAIMGGAKVSDKIGVIRNLLDKVDTILIGGGMAYTFERALGRNIGKSICEDDKLELAKSLVEEAKQKGVNLVLPLGCKAAKEFKNDTEIKEFQGSIPDDWMGLDIDSATVDLFAKYIKPAGTIIWNGPMGVFEMPNFAEGTKAVASLVAESDAISIIGGGDSAAAVEQLGFADKITHISTGGGASLEFLEGIELPGIAALMDKKKARKKFIAGNWKMNKTPNETFEFITALKETLKDAEAVVACAVPFVCLQKAIEAAKGSNIKIAAQNMYFEESGAFTGEVSGPMLKEMGVEYVIIGHSERRQYFAETDETVNKKVHAAFKYGLKPIVCVGESLTQREQGVTEDLVRYQVKIALLGLTAEQVKDTVIAYEPIWAIGTGKTATSEQANEVCAIIRDTVKGLYGEAVANEIIIQYGGSVKPDNAKELFEMSDIDGGLVGGASLKVKDFTAIVKY